MICGYMGMVCGYMGVVCGYMRMVCGYMEMICGQQQITKTIRETAVDGLWTPEYSRSEIVNDPYIPGDELYTPGDGL